MAKSGRIKNLVVISDLHCGCKFGLCPPKIRLDGAGGYEASPMQVEVWKHWNKFWKQWVPKVTRNEPYAVVLNGDAMDHRHHNSVTQVSQNMADQQNIAREVLEPVVEGCDGYFYVNRGTEAHTGPSAEEEEKLADHLNALQDEYGHSSRYELWIEVGKCLVHLSHHIGVTSSSAYETSALMGEYANTCVDAAKWKMRAPDVIVRSHRHIHSEVKVPTRNEYGIIFVTSGWQLKTPFVFKTPGGRVRSPTIGGSLIRQGDEEFYTRHKTWPLKRSKTEIPRVEVP